LKRVLKGLMPSSDILGVIATRSERVIFSEALRACVCARALSLSLCPGDVPLTSLLLIFLLLRSSSSSPDSCALSHSVRRRNIEMVAAAAAHNNREREREKNRCIIKYITKHTDRPELFQSPRSLSLSFGPESEKNGNTFLLCVCLIQHPVFLLWWLGRFFRWVSLFVRFEEKIQQAKMGPNESNLCAGQALRDPDGPDICCSAYMDARRTGSISTLHNWGVKK
jgi:hypothetical protein